MQKEDRCTSKSGISVRVFKGLNENKKSKLGIEETVNNSWSEC